MRMLKVWVPDPSIVARIAVTDGRAAEAVSKLKEAGHDVDLEPGQLDGFDAVVV